MKLGIYSSAFNLIKHKFDFKTTIDNWLKFADVINIAINTSEDDTFEQLELLYEQHPDKISVFKTDISYQDPDFDGKIKDIALQNCNADILLGLDMDEVVPKSVHERLRFYAEILATDNEVKGYMLPSVDLYQDIHHFNKIGEKWYLHKKAGCHRGTVNFAKNEDGTHDIKRSDSCELIDKDGDLVPCKTFMTYKEDPLDRMNFVLDNDMPYVLHLGHVDLDRRYELNKNFWKQQWEVESGTNVDMRTMDEMKQEKVYKHNFDLSL